MLYLLIFSSKVIENALSTLRLIVVSNGKKKLGATLQGVIAIVWIIVTGVVVININKDPLKIVFFALGSLVGSYIGSLIEEKIALGSNLLTIVVSKDMEDKVVRKIDELNYKVTIIDGRGLKKERSILLIIVSRKERVDLIKEIKKIDKDALVVVESAYAIKRTINV